MRAILLSALLLGGCALPGSTSDVMLVGRDTYWVGGVQSELTGGAVGARALALQKANAFCGTMRKTTKVVQIEPAGIMRTNVTFQCLSVDDPRLDQPAPGGIYNVNINSSR